MPDSKTALVAVPRNPQNLPAPTYYLPPPHQEFEAEAPSVPLSHYLWILRRHFWRILVFVVTCVAATFVISSPLAPIYAPPSSPPPHSLCILPRHFWRILVFVVTCVAATFVISSRLAPIYEASAVVDIDRQARSEERRVGKERRS